MAIRTRARAKIEEDIAALTKEVSELRRKRGAGMPDIETLCDFVVAAIGRERAVELAEAVGYRGLAWIGEAVSELQVAPAAQELQAAAVAAFEASVQDDLSCFVRASQLLREVLLVLLTARAEKWRNRSEARDIYPSSWQSMLDPAEHVRAAVPKLNRWELLIWSGKALACAREDVWSWQLWQTGWREYQEEVHRTGRSGMTEKDWQRELAEHALPEEEAVIVDSWPVPPDDQWPDRNTREFTLPRLRKWQAEQRAANGTSDQEQQG
jgi:hypothetical protein